MSVNKRHKRQQPVSLHPLQLEDAIADLFQVKPQKESEMSYMKLEEFPESVRALMRKLPGQERNRLLYPHGEAAKGRQIQETIIQVLEASIKEGEPEEKMLERLIEYAQTEWP